MLKLISVLVVTLAISGCANRPPDVVYLKTECSVPVRAQLPEIDAGELWDAVGADVYDTLLLRERLIVDWAVEMQYMLQVICRGD